MLILQHKRQLEVLKYFDCLQLELELELHVNQKTSYSLLVIIDIVCKYYYTSFVRARIAIVTPCTCTSGKLFCICVNLARNTHYFIHLCRLAVYNKAPNTNKNQLNNSFHVYEVLIFNKNIYHKCNCNTSTNELNVLKISVAY